MWHLLADGHAHFSKFLGSFMKSAAHLTLGQTFQHLALTMHSSLCMAFTMHLVQSLMVSAKRMFGDHVYHLPDVMCSRGSGEQGCGLRGFGQAIHVLRQAPFWQGVVGANSEGELTSS